MVPGNEMNRTIAIGFVIYGPEPSLLPRLQVAVESGFAVYVFDNSPARSEVRDFCRKHTNCRYSTCGRNVGLGIGLSAVCSQAYYDAHPALLFFDQDTVFEDSTLDFVERFHERNRALASSYSAIVFDAKDADRARGENGPAVKKVLLAISSGSLFFLENLCRMNWHNPRYFVDGVDYEFCLNSSNSGLRVGRSSTTPGFDHQSEQPDETYRILGKDWRIRKYPARRILDTLTSSARLMGTSIATGNFRFLAAIARSFGIYGGAQILVRVLRSANQEKRIEK